MGSTQKVEMFKRIPRLPVIHQLNWVKQQSAELCIDGSSPSCNTKQKCMRLYVGKPTYPSEIWWHMNLARKHMRKYQVDATLTDRNL